MNSAVLTETEVDQKNDVESGKIEAKETAVEMPEENNASTAVIETEKDQKKEIESSGSDVKETAVDIPDENKATTSTQEAPPEDTILQKQTEFSSPPANSEGSPDIEIPQKDLEINTAP